MNTILDNHLRAALAKRSALFQLQAPSPTATDLFSNDYLSLSRNPYLRSDFMSRLSLAPNILGSSGSRRADGNTSNHVALETKIRQHYGTDAALLFNSGFDANLAIFGTLPQQRDVIVYDEYIHASALDGMRSSRAARSIFPFEHNSVPSLKSVLQSILNSSSEVRLGSRTVFVAFETLYSMDGDVAPIEELVGAVEETMPKGCFQIVIDEAHSSGLYGTGGRGLVSHLGLEKRVHIQLHTFSKALASTGAVILCSPLIRMYLINFSRPFIYTTALSPACLISTEASMDLIKGPIGDQLRDRLFALLDYATELLRKALASVPSNVIRLPPPLASNGHTSIVSPMIPILTPHAVRICLWLQQQGWAAVPMIYPTVPKGAERIRLIIHAGNTEKEIKEFVQALLVCLRDEEVRRDIGPGIVFDDQDRIEVAAKL